MRPVTCAAPSMASVALSPTLTSRRSTSHAATRPPETERHIDTVQGLPACIMSRVIV